MSEVNLVTDLKSVSKSMHRTASSIDEFLKAYQQFTAAPTIQNAGNIQTLLDRVTKNMSECQTVMITVGEKFKTLSN